MLQCFFFVHFIKREIGWYDIMYNFILRACQRKDFLCFWNTNEYNFVCWNVAVSCSKMSVVGQCRMQASPATDFSKT